MTTMMPSLASLLPIGQINLSIAIESARQVGENYVLPLSDTLLQAADTEIRAALNVPIVDIFARAWEKALDIDKASQKSIKSPTKPETVQLAKHEINGAEHPELAFEVNGIAFSPVRLDLEYKVTLQSAIIGILNGTLDSVELGEIRFKLSFKFLGHRLLPDWEPAPIHLPGRIQFQSKQVSHP
jgi:hypothetical protein